MKTYPLAVYGAIAILHGHGFETQLNGNHLDYRRRFTGTHSLQGSIEIYGPDEEGEPDLQEQVDLAVATAERFEADSDRGVEQHPMTDSDLGIALQHLTDRCHNASYAAGWWHHADSGIPYIPGDDARATTINGNLHLIPWDRLPSPIRDMVIHYWPILLACKIALVHSEASEALEGIRKGMMDDKLAHRTAVDTEISDEMIRNFDLAGAIRRARRLGIVDFRQHNIDMPVTLLEKIGYNAVRPDHKLGARTSAGGKYF